jgi:hypothetical protein
MIIIGDFDGFTFGNKAWLDGKFPNQMHINRGTKYHCFNKNRNIRCIGMMA